MVSFTGVCCSTDPEAAKMVVLGDKPVIEDDTFRLEPALLNVLIGQIATLSSVYHKPPEAFVVRGPRVGATEEYDEEEDEEEYEDENDVGEDGGGADLLDMGGLGITDKLRQQGGGDVFGSGSGAVRVS